MSFGVGNELGNRPGRKGWIYHHDVGLAANAHDRPDVADEIVVELVVKSRVNRVRLTRQEERVTVTRCTHNRLGTDICAGTRSVLDDERLAKSLREPLPDQAGRDVDRSSGGKSNDDVHWPRRIGLRAPDPRHDRECGSARCQMQELAAGKFHGAPPGDTDAIPIPVPLKGAAISFYSAWPLHQATPWRRSKDSTLAQRLVAEHSTSAFAAKTPCCHQLLQQWTRPVL
jgi:hypothetical protein